MILWLLPWFVLMGSEKVSIIFYCSRSRYRSLKVLAHFAATKKWGSERKKNWLMWVEYPPKPSTYRWNRGQHQHGALRAGQMCYSCIPCHSRLQVYPTPWAGRCRCSCIQSAIAWDLDQPALLSGMILPQLFICSAAGQPLCGDPSWMRWKEDKLLQALGKDWVHTCEQLVWNST